jgi:hypothetical protein
MHRPRLVGDWRPYSLVHESGTPTSTSPVPPRARQRTHAPYRPAFFLSLCGLPFHLPIKRVTERAEGEGDTDVPRIPAGLPEKAARSLARQGLLMTVRLEIWAGFDVTNFEGAPQRTNPKSRSSVSLCCRVGHWLNRHRFFLDCSCRVRYNCSASASRIPSACLKMPLVCF